MSSLPWHKKKLCLRVLERKERQESITTEERALAIPEEKNRVKLLYKKVKRE